MRAALVDYGAGNLRSAARALADAGAEVAVVADPAGLTGADLIVLPGVGAFAPAMRRLHAAGLAGAIVEAAGRGTPLVGICLGMQLLFEQSEEGDPEPGLALLRGTVRRLPDGVKTPHMGWNTLVAARPSAVLAGLPEAAHVYFVHSYVVAPADPDVVLAETDYGVRFPAIVRAGRIWGLQFHPEKSSRTGRRLLTNLLAQLEADRLRA
ncbi:MAG: imidazole glycerol phosphate synthase subunit HisH [Armatimonadota bacterium]|nr:imidazole glycerol phosphate synthase subunit HisH [Armatimonadota bacterium]MDR7456645.1 imidazole glycerol phosphate synthase subunit HisH [Armatimonadota bacterium]MDR7495545.1 imidazole glycerol phosphate synthase subunit HisH [Armatimonadota bacterium]MDR7510714.1 imidazole glycerol phosphate synthase subunit HisH [Armatimonadota bacterium]